MKAKFAGRCRCGLEIVPGQEIMRAGSRWVHRSCSQRSTSEDAEYRQGMAEVAQIQAISLPGSALREQLYLEMEMAAYNRGEE